MYQIDFNKPIHIHFMGIGGISMSGLAEILIKEGFTISGSDIHTSDIIKHLEDKGAKVYLSQTADNITDDIDLVVYTAAINFDTNEEYKEAIRRNIPVMKRATLLGQMMHNYQNAIAVSGTHGKTTTTSMLSYILLAGNTDPTISVGGILDAINGNIRVGHSETFVTEACEYTNSFLEFFPKISIILNIEEDHMDFFKDLDDIRHSFREFAHKLPDYGYLIINGEIENIDYIVDGLKAEYATFGLENDSYDYCAKNIGYDAFGHAHFDYYYKGEFIDHIQLNVNGEHNVKNALAAIAAAKRIGIDVDTMKKGLLGFTGAKRRFELKGTCNDFTVVDDYAHHPTEIRATLESLAYQVNDVLQSMKADSGIQLASLKVDGGASANDFLMQTQADIINAPVNRPQCVETTAMGAAYLAGLAVNYWTSKEDVLKNWAIDKTFTPQIADTERVKRIKGWEKAVKYAYGWARDEED